MGGGGAGGRSTPSRDHLSENFTLLKFFGIFVIEITSFGGFCEEIMHKNMGFVNVKR